MRMFKHLTFTDRLKIEVMLKEKKKPREISDVLRVHISTIYRELKRGKYEHLNSDLTTDVRYSPDIAQARYEDTFGAKGTDLKIGKDREYAEYIEDLILNKHYSPDAALGQIKRDGLEFKTKVCTATLYSYIRKGVFLHLTSKHLPRKGVQKQKYEKVTIKRAPRGDSIEKRPESIKSRDSIGHWEMDTVVGKKRSKRVLLVLTERATRKEVIIRMPDKTAASVVRALDKLESKYGKRFSKIFKTITVDNGSEFSDCKGMERSNKHDGVRTKIYYCHPYSAYERGSNENQNILIRRFFPKGTNFDKVATKYISRVEKWINSYPRALLGYKTSDDLFNEYLCSLDV